MTPAATRNSWATRILAVLAKEFVQLTRDKLTYAMILMIPVVQLLLFGYAINNEPRHLPTAVLVQDNSTLARSTLASFVNTQFFDITHEAHSVEELDMLLREGKVQFALVNAGEWAVAYRGGGTFVIGRRGNAEWLFTCRSVGATAQAPWRNAIAFIPRRHD